MKREMNVKIFTVTAVLIGLLSQHSTAHAAVTDHSSPAVRRGNSAEDRPQVFKDILGSLDAANDIQTSKISISGEVNEFFKVEKPDAQKISAWVEKYADLTIGLKACKADPDSSAQELATLVEDYTRALRWSLFARTINNAEVKPSADEKTLVAFTSQIQKVLKARGAVAKNETSKPFASELEKQVSSMLDKQLALFFGESRQSEFDDKAQKADNKHQERVEQADRMVAQLKDLDKEDLCQVQKSENDEGPNTSANRVGNLASTWPSARAASTPTDTNKAVRKADDSAVPPTGNAKNKNDETPDGDAAPIGIPDLSSLLARLDEAGRQLEQQRLDQGDILRQFQDAAALEQSRRAAELAELAALDRDRENDALANSLGALANRDNNQAPAAPAPAAPAAAPVQPSDVGSNQQPFFPPQEDPYGQQGQQQAPYTPMMMNQQPYGNSAASSYRAEKNPFAEDDYSDRRPIAPPVIMSPQAGAMQAQQQLMMAMQGAQGGGMYGMNPAMGGAAGGMAARLAQAQIAPRSNARLGAPGQVGAALSSVQSLAKSSPGRSRTVPSFLQGRI